MGSSPRHHGPVGPLARIRGASKRRRIATAVGTALACLVVPAAAAQATGAPSHAASQAASHQTLQDVLNSARKFGPAVQRIAATAHTPQQRALMEGKLVAGPATSTLPIQVAAYEVKPLWKQGITGKGVSSATIVSFGDPNIASVMESYDTQYGLPKAKVTILQPDGSATCPPGQESVCADWAVETDLDIEMMHTLAPGAHLYVVATPVAETEGRHGFPQMMQAIDYLLKHQTVDVISMSLGATEQTFGSIAQLKRTFTPTFKRAQAAGIPILAATGDEGATGYRRHGGATFTHRVVGVPAADPLVTAVGGTVLHMSGSKRTEPDSLVDFSGGGTSRAFGRPAWQDPESGITQSTRRAMPDITMEGIEGTSMASPLFAGILDLATQANGDKPLGYLNPVLYQMGPSGTKDGIVDVTEGSNTFDGVTGYTCATGFDIASGWGTIDGAKFVPALVSALNQS